MFACLLGGCSTASKTFDVRTFGATGDGSTKDTAAFQKALDAAVKDKGGTVLVPAGNYLIGSIALGSNTTLRLEKAATLTGSPDKDDYPIMTIRWEGVWRDGHRALIYSGDSKNLAIVGPGKIVGNFPLGHLRNPRGPCIIETINCDDVRFEDFSIQYERMWAIHPTYCTNVTAKNLTIRSTLDNGDGIDVDSCRDVRIEHCDIDTGDDAIALKSGRGAEGARIARPTEDIVITDCKLGSRFAGLAIGSEMSGGVRNVRAQRCTFTRGANAIFIKSRVGRGGFIENIACRDLDAPAGGARTFLRIDVTSTGKVGDDPIPGMAYDSNHREVSVNYLKAMNIPLRQGRYFDKRDNETSMRVAIINETMARQYWPGENALGRRFNIGDPNDGEWMEIVGIVADVRQMGLDEPVKAEMYFPYRQITDWLGYIPRDLAIRTSGETSHLVGSVRQIIRDVDADQPISNIATMSEVLGVEGEQRRMGMIMLVAFAGLALLLASLGIYGVLAYFVTQHTNELGVRMALGASQRNILALVLKKGMGLTLLGVAIGIAVSFALTRLMSSLLFGVKAFDPLTFVTVPLLLATVALVACWIPARRAAKVDPMVALRYE